jgi:hypothetical protein
VATTFAYSITMMSIEDMRNVDDVVAAAAVAAAEQLLGFPETAPKAL